MARSASTAPAYRDRYYWPDVQLNVWILIMLATAGTLLGINASFVVVQNALRQPIPWLFPFGITVGALTVVLLLAMMALIVQRQLVPGAVLLAAFILAVLYVTGIVGTALQLFAGPNISGQCNLFVNDMKVVGPSASTLAWLEQQSICQSWSAQFAFWIIGTVFLVWMMIMANLVNQNQYD